jgi:anti-anti-sigma regulatory factor
VLKVEKEQKGETLILTITGDVVEGVDFATLIDKTAPDTVLNCKGVTRLNSVGVKAWIGYFQKEWKQGTKFRFVECSPAVVEQINLIMNFSCGGTVESMYLPFSCVACKKNLAALFKVEDLKRAGLKPPTIKCTHCGGQAPFDDIPEEYFLFMQR